MRRDRRHRDADRLRSARPHDRLRALRRVRRPRTSGAPPRTRALTLLDAVPAPSGSHAGGAASAARAACCSTRRAVTGSRPISSTRTRRCSKAQIGEQVASPLVTLVDDGALRPRVGHVRDRRRGPPRAAQRAHRGRRAHRLHVGPRARPQGRARAERATAGARRYQHLPMVRMTNTFLLDGRRPIPTTSSATPSTASTACSSAAARSNTATGDFVFGVTEAYLIEHGEITRAGPRRAAHRQRPRDAAAGRRGRQRLRHLDRHVRQGRPGRAGVVGPADPARARDDRRRHRGVSRPSCSTSRVSVARRGARRRAGRGLRRPLARDRRRGVRRRGRVADGREVDGVGVRVDRRPPPGLRVGGLARPRRRRRDAARGARQRDASASPTSGTALATPADVDGAAAADLDLWRDELAVGPTDEKVALALELERATQAADPRIRGVESAGYGDARSRPRSRTRSGVEAHTRRTDVLGVVGRDGRRRHGHPDRLRLRRRPHVRRSRSRSIPRDAAERARATARRASRSPGRRIPVVLDPLVTRSVLGVLVERVQRRVDAEGPFAVRRPRRRAIGAPIVHAGRRPDRRARRSARRTPRRRGRADAPHRARSSTVCCKGFLHNVYTGRRSGAGTTGSAARGYHVDARASACARCGSSPGAQSPERDHGVGAARRSTCSR